MSQQPPPDRSPRDTPRAPRHQPLWLGHRAPQEPDGPAAPAPERKRRVWPFLVLGLLALVGLSAGVVVAVSTGDAERPGSAVTDLRAGDCLVSIDLARGRPSVGRIRVVGCDEPHDAEVFATFALTAGELAGFDIDAVGARCVDRLMDAGSSLAELQQQDLEVRPLVATADPQEGDTVVCFLRHVDGDRLSGPSIG